MASVTITLADTPAGGISIRSDYQPAVGNPCSRAQAAALEILSRTRKEFGLPVQSTTGAAVAVLPVKADGLDIDAVHRTRDHVVNTTKGVDVCADRLNFHFTSGDANALQVDNSDRRFFAIEDRSPGIAELAEKLFNENPIWSSERCLNEAKARITAKAAA